MRAWPVKNSVGGPETAQNAAIDPPLRVRSDSLAWVIRCGATRRNGGVGSRAQFKRGLSKSAGRLRFAHIFVCVARGGPNGVTGAMTAGCGGIVFCLFGEVAGFDEAVEAGFVFCREELDFYCGGC